MGAPQLTPPTPPTRLPNHRLSYPQEGQAMTQQPQTAIESTATYPAIAEFAA